MFVPAAAACVAVFCKSCSQQQRLATLIAVLLQPAAVLIDHGHFQYNNISLGLTAGAAAAIGAGHDMLGSMLYCLALNHKQMALYYAPAFFGHLLGKCLQRKGWPSKVRRSLSWQACADYCARVAMSPIGAGGCC